MATAPCLRCLLFGLPRSKTYALDSHALAPLNISFTIKQASFLRSPVIFKESKIELGFLA